MKHEQSNAAAHQLETEIPPTEARIWPLPTSVTSRADRAARLAVLATLSEEQMALTVDLV